MSDIEFIKNIKAYSYGLYSKVSSREKLIAFAIDYLNNNNIQTTFNNVCITAFKLFPEKFYFSEDFPEYPHIEMLNRTLLHLRPKERNYATGSARTTYVLTPIGVEIVKTVKADLNDTNEISYPKKIMDEHKQSQASDYQKLVQSRGYIVYKNSNTIEIDYLWEFYEITPFTQLEKTKKRLKSIQSYCQTINDTACNQYITLLLDMI